MVRTPRTTSRCASSPLQNWISWRVALLPRDRWPLHCAIYGGPRVLDRLSRRVRRRCLRRRRRRWSGGSSCSDMTAAAVAVPAAAAAAAASSSRRDGSSATRQQRDAMRDAVLRLTRARHFHARQLTSSSSRAHEWCGVCSMVGWTARARARAARGDRHERREARARGAPGSSPARSTHRHERCARRTARACAHAARGDLDTRDVVGWRLRAAAPRPRAAARSSSQHARHVRMRAIRAALCTRCLLRALRARYARCARESSSPKMHRKSTFHTAKRN